MGAYPIKTQRAQLFFSLGPQQAVVIDRVNRVGRGGGSGYTFPRDLRAVAAGPGRGAEAGARHFAAASANSSALPARIGAAASTLTSAWDVNRDGRSGQRRGSALLRENLSGSELGAAAASAWAAQWRLREQRRSPARARAGAMRRFAQAAGGAAQAMAGDSEQTLQGTSSPAAASPS